MSNTVHKQLRLPDGIHHQECYDLVIGDFVGDGSFRRVHRYGGSTSEVVKVAKDHYGILCNIEEYNTWVEASTQHDDIKKWFAPCNHISVVGTLLIQEYATPLPYGERYKIPAFMADIKPANFGLLNGQVVAVDYGQHNLRSIGWDYIIKSVSKSKMKMLTLSTVNGEF